MTTETKLSPQQRVTNAIVAAIENGVAPWACPWDRSGAMRRPLRSTGQPYAGVNVLSLWTDAQLKGFTSAYWFTFKQALDLGACVRKGEKASVVVYYGQTTDKRAKSDDADEISPSFRFLKGYAVFNAQQIDGLDAQFTQSPTVRAQGWDNVADLDAWTKATGVRVTEGGDRACYSPLSDSVSMPDRYRFPEAHDFYSTLFHELTHATGASHRVGREFGKRFGDEAYAMEELVAELGAAFLCAHHGIGKSERTDHASYLASWLKVLKEDSRAIFKVAGAAQVAADWLTTRAAGADLAQAA